MPSTGSIVSKRLQRGGKLTKPDNQGIDAASWVGNDVMPHQIFYADTTQRQLMATYGNGDPYTYDSNKIDLSVLFKSSTITQADAQLLLQPKIAYMVLDYRLTWRQSPDSVSSCLFVHSTVTRQWNLGGREQFMNAPQQSAVAVATKPLIHNSQKIAIVTIVKNTFLQIGTTIVGTGLGFFFWWWAAREFTPGQVGFAATSISAMNVFSLLGSSGIGWYFMGEIRKQRESAGD